MFADVEAYLAKLPPRDRMALLALTLFLGVFVVGWGGWSLHKKADQAQQQAAEDKQTFMWMQSVAPRVSNTNLAGNGGPVLDVISSAAAGQGIVLERFEPDGERVRVWLEKADFARVATWMNTLARQGVRADEVHFEQNEQGLSVRLVFGR